MRNPNCPNLNCVGTLERTQAESTCMGFLDFDTNTYTESFKCDTCGNEFTRHWKWKKEEK